MNKKFKKKAKEIFYLPYCVYREWARLKADRKKLWKEAVDKFEKEHPKQNSLQEYGNALKKHRVSYWEYYTYELWRMDEKKRKEFIGESEMRCIYRKTVKKSIIRKIDNKHQALILFEKYIHRKWLFAPKASFDAFCDFVNATDCFAKPIYGSLGMGIVKINNNSPTNMQELYSYCCKNNTVIEECAKQIKEMEAFHPQSLNTVRVMTLSKGGKCELLGSVFRMGVGNSFIDNVSSGGVYALVDLETGELVSDGIDNKGGRYVTHPDTGIAIKGFVIPCWDKVKNACTELTSIVPDLIFAGWDFSIRPNGEVELIESNSAPNIYGIQAPLKKGLKPKLSAVGKEILGYDPAKLISIWSKPHVKLEERYQYF